MKTYLVFGKGDDYARCRTDLVETTKQNAKSYYHSIEIEENDVPVLMKYFKRVPADEEKERTEDERYYGYN